MGSTNLHVVVIGAGISGLQFARVLADHPGIKITILEGRAALGGTWAPAESYHNLATHAPRASFDVLFPGEDKKYEGASQEEVYDALRSHCDRHSLGDLIRYNCSVVRLEHLKGSAVVHLANNEKISADMVIYTGATFLAHVPKFPGASQFQGVVSAAKDVRTEQFEDILREGKRVIVLGGSKAAQDMVYNFCERGYYNFSWVFRRTYWGLSFAYTLQRFGLQTGFFRRFTPFLRKLMFRVMLDHDTGKAGFVSWLYMLILVATGYLLNPKRTDRILGSFHGGIIKEERNQVLAKLEPANWERTEIASLVPDGAILANKKKIQADVIICATGQANVKVPVIDKTGVPYEAHKHRHNSLFRGLFNPCHPRIMYMNTIGIGHITGNKALSIDANMVAEWLLKCYLPGLINHGDDSMQQLMWSGLKHQECVLRSTDCRRFDLWMAFDRPIPYTAYVSQRLIDEVMSGSISSDDPTDGKYWIGKAFEQMNAGLAFRLP